MQTPEFGYPLLYWQDAVTYYWQSSIISRYKPPTALYSVLALTYPPADARPALGLRDEPYTLVHTLLVNAPVQYTKQSLAATVLHAVSPKISHTETEHDPPEHNIDEFWHGVSLT